MEVLHQTRRPLGKNGGEEGSPRKSSASVLPLLACFLCLTPPPARPTYEKRAGPKLSPSWFVAPVQGQGAALIVKCVQHTQQTGQKGEGEEEGRRVEGRKERGRLQQGLNFFPLFSSKGKRRDHAKPSLPS